MQYTFALLPPKSASMLEMGNYFMLYKIFGEREGNESVATDATLVSNNIQATMVQSLRFFLRFMIMKNFGVTTVCTLVLTLL